MNITLLAVPAVTMGLTAVVIQVGRKHLLDHPNARSSHQVATPKGGGIAVMCGVVMTVTMSRNLDLVQVAALVIGLAAVSLRDDIRPLSPRLRFVFHALAAVAALALFGAFPVASVPGLGSVTNPLVLLAMTLCWLIGMTNAYNFMDGIDGIATGQGIVVGLLWWKLGNTFGIETLTWGGAALALSCLAFLPFNWKPAKIFLGDVGSAPLGFLIAMLPILAARDGNAAPWAAAVGALSVWPFLFDTLFTFVRRARRGEALLEAHRSHLYQRMVIAGWSHAQVTIVYLALALINGLSAIALTDGQYLWCWLAAIWTGIVLIFLTATLERQARPAPSPAT